MWSCGASPQASPSFRTRTIPAGSTNSPCGSSACQARTTCPSSWRARHCCASALWMRDRAFASSGSCARLTTRAGRATGSSSPCSPRASSRATARTLTASCSRARCAKSPCCGTRRSAAAFAMSFWQSTATTGARTTYPASPGDRPPCRSRAWTSASDWRLRAACRAGPTPSCSKAAVRNARRSKCRSCSFWTFRQR